MIMGEGDPNSFASDKKLKSKLNGEDMLNFKNQSKNLYFSYLKYSERKDGKSERK